MSLNTTVINPYFVFFISKGRPMPTVTWWGPDNNPLNTTSIEISEKNKTVKSTLQLNRFERKDLHNRWYFDSPDLSTVLIFSQQLRVPIIEQRRVSGHYEFSDTWFEL